MTVIIPTLGRPSLKAARDSLERQTLRCEIIEMWGKEDTETKKSLALAWVNTPYVAIADDDAIYPPRWLESLMKVYRDMDSDSYRIGYVGGSMLPMTLRNPSEAGDAEKCIAEVSSTWFGTTNMSQRVKIGKKIEERDETNMAGNGLYRTEVIKQFYANSKKIPPGFSETYIINRLRSMGYHAMYCPDGYFYHSVRKNLGSYAKQIFRCGIGRIRFFKQFPRQAVRKFYILIPAAFIIYLPFAIFLPAPLVIYLMLNLSASFMTSNHRSIRLPAYFFVEHVSYGTGELLGLFREVRTWD